MSIASARHKQPWTPAENELLTRWVQETQAQLPAHANGIPKKAWEEIAAKVNKTAVACMARARSVLNLLTSKSWTEQEESLLRELIEENRSESDLISEGQWEKIASRFDGRTASACRVHAMKLHLLQPRKHWTEEEESLLRELIEENRSESGIISEEQWKKIASRFDGRTASACRIHAMKLHLLTPRKQWTEEEESLLRELIEENRSESGTISEEQWKKIALQFKRRTVLACRFHATQLDLLTPRQQWTIEEERQLKKLVENNSTESGAISEEQWKKIALQFDERTARECRNHAGRLGLLTSSKHWTAEEKLQLQELVEKNKRVLGCIGANNWLKIANTLGRTREGCKKHARQLKLLELGSWTGEKITKLQAWLAARSKSKRKNWTEIAAQLGKTERACKSKAMRLKEDLEQQQAAFAALDKAPFVPASLVADVGPVDLTPREFSEILALKTIQE